MRQFPELPVSTSRRPTSLIKFYGPRVISGSSLFGSARTLIFTSLPKLQSLCYLNLVVATFRQQRVHARHFRWSPLALVNSTRGVVRLIPHPFSNECALNRRPISLILHTSLALNLSQTQPSFKGCRL